MLEFIVLGKVPGTEVYLPFTYVLFALGFFVALYVCLKTLSPSRHSKKKIRDLIETAI